MLESKILEGMFKLMVAGAIVGVVGFMVVSATHPKHMRAVPHKHHAPVKIKDMQRRVIPIS